MKQKMLAIVWMLGIFAVSASARTLYVDGNSTNPVSPFTNVTQAAVSIQDAVDAAFSGDRIEIAAGTYTSTAANVVNIENKVLDLIGVGRDVVFIDGEDARRGVRFYNNSVSRDFRFEGFTVTNGYTSAEGAGIYVRWLSTATGAVTLGQIAVVDCTSGGANGAGGMYFQRNIPTCPLTISRSLFRGNTAAGTDGYGGGIHIFSSDAVLITDTEFRENHADGGGGAIRFDGGTLTLRDCRLVDNSANRLHGGALRLQGSEALLERCELRGNTSVSWAGGLVSYVAKLTLRNSLLVGNEGSNSGAIAQTGGDGLIENCTIVGNKAATASGSGGIRLTGGHLAITNSILYYNQDFTASSSSDNLRVQGTVPTMSMGYSAMTRPDPPVGNGNISVTPGFVDPGSDYGTNHVAGDYRLDRGSPCINAGTLLAWMDDDARDLDGSRRVDRPTGLVDMGAYEYLFGGTLLLLR